MDQKESPEEKEVLFGARKRARKEVYDPLSCPKGWARKGGSPEERKKYFLSLEAEKGFALFSPFSGPSQRFFGMGFAPSFGLCPFFSPLGL
jgi:hypothetical protein